MTYQEMKSGLEMLSSPEDKLEMVMDYGKHLESVPDNAICSEILGCVSHVEICRDGNKFFGRADSGMVRGIVAIILAMVDGKTPKEIKEMNLLEEFMSLNLPLGTGRIGGVNSMIRFLQNL